MTTNESVKARLWNLRTALMLVPFLVTVGVAPGQGLRAIALAVICGVGTMIGYYCGRIEALND